MGAAGGVSGLDGEARAEEALSRFLPTVADSVARTHHVTAVVLAHQGAQWLPRTLAGLAAQLRAPDRVIGVDACSDDGSRQLLAEQQMGGDQQLCDTVVDVPADVVAAAGMPGALALTAESAPAAAGSTHQVRWLWLVHDDSAPQPDCLQALLEGADRHPEAQLIVPKTVAWRDDGRLVGIGNRWSPGLPVVEHLDVDERDQGQHDTDRPVYTASSAGILVRADTWAALGGMDARYGQWAACADLCRRVWGSGGQVWFVPAAVLAHRRAGTLGVRGGTPPRPAPRRAARRGQLMLELTQGGRPALPWRWLRGWLSTFARALALLLTREPEEATATLHGAWDVLAHPRRVRAGRRALRRPPVVTTARPPAVRARRGASLAHSVDAWVAASGRARPPTSARPPRRLWLPLGIAGALAVAALARDPGVILGSGTLRGGGLLPATGAGELLRQYLAGWQDTRFGLATAQPAYLPLLAAASVPLLGSVDLLLRILFGLAVPLAFLSAYAALGAGFVGRQRVPLALAWAMLPAGVAAMSGGRISTLAVLLLGPPAARLIARAVGRARNPEVGIRRAIAAGTVLGVTVAFAPLVYALAVVAALLAWLASGLPRWPVRNGLVTLLVAGLFLALWGPRAVRAPWLVLSDLGRSDRSLGAPAPWLWGLSPGGPTAVGWAGVPLLATAVIGVLLLTRTPRMLAAVVVALGLLAAVAWLPAGVARAWPQVDAATLWPGQPMLVAGGILAVVVARLAQRDGPRRLAVQLAWAGCIAALAVAWWVAPSTMSTTTASGVPAVVGLAEESADQPRALVLSRSGEEIRYAVSTSPDAGLGAADALAAPAEDPVFTATVRDVVSGAAAQVETVLGSRGIRYVVLAGPDDDPLLTELDAVPGLRRLASSRSETLWLVTGEPARAELVGPTEHTEPVLVPVTTTPTSVDVVLHPEIELPRTLVVAERSDPGWSATLDRKPLDLGTDAQGMLTATVISAGPLTLRHVSAWPYLSGTQLAVFVVLGLVSLPKRRPVDLDDPRRAPADADTGAPS